MPHSKTTPCELDAVYCATAYTVPLSTGNLVIRVGQCNPYLDAKLSLTNCNQWAFLSACNPYSRQCAASENVLHHQRLKAIVCQQGFQINKTLFEGAGIPDAGDWHPEPSWLILGISLKEASALALSFEQNAYVYGELGNVAQLIYVT